eukprot:8404951-Pyramimonas_sp.AAC.1
MAHMLVNMDKVHPYHDTHASQHEQGAIHHTLRSLPRRLDAVSANKGRRETQLSRLINHMNKGRREMQLNTVYAPVGQMADPLFTFGGSPGVTKGGEEDAAVGVYRKHPTTVIAQNGARPMCAPPQVRLSPPASPTTSRVVPPLRARGVACNLAIVETGMSVACKLAIVETGRSVACNLAVFETGTTHETNMQECELHYTFACVMLPLTGRYAPLQ